MVKMKDQLKDELQGLRKINKDASPELSTRLKYIITAIEGNPDKTRN